VSFPCPIVGSIRRWTLSSAFLGLAFPLLAASPVVAQGTAPQGTITGVVMESEGPPLAGASVVVEGTGVRARTNASGYYRISGVPAGDHEVTVTFIGYREANQRVSVSSGEISRVDLVMQIDPVALDAVVVSGRRYSAAQALNDQRTAPQIKNVLSTEQAERFADVSLPDALRRIPGVSAELDRGESSTVFLRGLSPAFTTVTLDGERLASSGLEDRSVNLAGIPVQMVEAVEVTKAITPDQDAESVGGTINLRARSPRSGTRRLQATLSRHSLEGDLGTQVSGMYGERFGRVGVLLDGSFQQLSVPEDDLQHWWTDEDFGQGAAPALDRLRLTIRPVERTRVNLGGTVDFRPDESTNLFLRAFASRFDSNEERHRYRYRFDRDSNRGPEQAGGVRIDRQGRDELDRRDVFTITAGGNHILDRANVDYTASVGRSTREELRDYLNFRQQGFTFAWDASDPLRIPLELVGDGDPYSGEGDRVRDYQRWENEATELDLSARLNAEFPFSLDNLSGSFQTGGKLSTRNKERTYTERAWDLNGPARFMSELTRNPEHRPVVFGRYRMGTITDWSRAMDWVQERFAAGELELDEDAFRIDSDPEDYDASETIGAGYAMGTLDLGQLTVLAGVRYEHTWADYEGNEVEFDETGAYVRTLPIQTDVSYGNLFPMLHLRYALDRQSNLRLAFTRSIARPSFTDLAPFQLINRDEERVTRGNPDLPPARSFNVDFMAERYFQSVGFLSAGLFLKRISDFEFTFRETLTDGPFAGFELREPRAGEEITVYGAEVAWQQRLRFLPGYWSGLGVYTNYTLSIGETEFESLNNRNVPLPGQSRHVANVGVSFDLGGLSALASYHYRGAFLEDIGADASDDRFWDGRGQLDVAVRQDLGNNAQVFLDLQNLTNAREQRYWGSIGDRSRPNRGVYQLRQAQLGVSWTP